MMKQLSTAAVLLAVLGATPSFAACPAPLAGDTPEVVAANRERLICLQRELSEKADEHQLKVEIDTLDRKIDTMQLQQRIDALQFTPPTTPGF